MSGVARVELEVRREGETAWHSLVAEGGEGRYSAVLDDAVYPKGSYEVRARVIDQAENERTIVKTPEGNVLRLALPARVATRLTAGKAKRVKKKTVLDERPAVSFGRSAC